MNIGDNIAEIESEIKPYAAKLIAVSKTKPAANIQEAYDYGQRHFGENKVQEMAEKYEALPKDIHWHMIGHLQRNKVKYMAPFVHLIHGVDSVKLLQEIDKEAGKCGRTIDCLLQVHIAEESSKFGFDEAELDAFLSSHQLEHFPNVRIIGLMGMATFTENLHQIREEFTGLKKLFDNLASRYTYSNFHLTELSMGMSGDYKIALECGSTMIRVGSSIFGIRNYDK